MTDRSVTVTARVRRDSDAVARIAHAFARHGATVTDLHLIPDDGAWSLHATLLAGDVAADRVRRQLSRVPGLDRLQVTAV